MGKTVLVADDNEQIRKAACALLMEAEGLADCIQAENGLEALRLAKELRPDLVILDFSMPVMDGIEAARHIHQALPHVPIVLFSLHGSLFELFDTAGTGVVAMISKDEAATKLLPTVHSLLGLPPALKTA